MLKSLLGLKSQTKIMYGLIFLVRLISNSGKNICSKNYTNNFNGIQTMKFNKQQTDDMAVK